MHRAYTRAASGVLLAFLLAACGGGGSDGDNTGGTTQASFGSVFEQAFNRAPTDEPVGGLTAASLGPVSYTTDPVPLN